MKNSNNHFHPTTTLDSRLHSVQASITTSQLVSHNITQPIFLFSNWLIKAVPLKCMYLETVTNQIFAALSNLQNPVAISTKIGLYLDKIHPARGQACMYLMNVTSNKSNSTSIRIEYMYIYTVL